MAFEKLFVRVKRRIGELELDATISETHSNKIRVTRNPVELGSDITDHAIIEPRIVNIVAQVSDTPLGVAAVGELVDSVTGLFGSSTSENITRSAAAYNQLVQLQRTREPIEIQTRLTLYTNMIITSVNVTQDANTSRVVALNIQAEEVLITESEIIQLTPEQLEAGRVRQQGSTPEKKGRVTTTSPDETTNKSVLKGVLDWVSD